MLLDSYLDDDANYRIVAAINNEVVGIADHPILPKIIKQANTTVKIIDILYF